MCVEKPKDGNISLFLNQKPSFLGDLFGFFLDDGFGISFFLFRFSFTQDLYVKWGGSGGGQQRWRSRAVSRWRTLW